MIFVVITLLILLSTSVFSLGVAPARKLYNYQTSIISGSIEVRNTESKDTNLIVYASGEYSEYLQLNEQILKMNADESSKKVGYTLNLPSNLKPGRHEIKIHVSEASSGASSSENNEMKTLNSVTALVFIDVPYPGKFLEGRLNVNSGTGTDVTSFTVSLFSKGDEKIEDIQGTIIIKGPTNEEITRVNTNTILLDVKASGKIVASLDQDLNSGLYYAEAVINYDGKQFTLREVFNVGDKELKITDLLFESFKLGGVAKVEVLVDSLWNKQIDNVHAEVDVIDEKDIIVENFHTITKNIPAMSSERLSGYLETTNLNVGNYDFNVKLLYEKKQTEKLFTSVVNADNIQITDSSALAGKVAGSGPDSGTGKDRTLSFLIIAVIVLIVINVFWFIVLKKIKKKLK